MSRQIKDIKDKNTGQLVYPRTHISAVVGLENFSGGGSSCIKFTNKTASDWEPDITYDNFKYKCDIACDGVTADMYAEVVFAMEQAVSGNYAPVCETGNGIVTIWSLVTDSIVIPTIIITE